MCVSLIAPVILASLCTHEGAFPRTSVCVCVLGVPKVCVARRPIVRRSIRAIKRDITRSLGTFRRDDRRYLRCTRVSHYSLVGTAAAVTEHRRVTSRATASGMETCRCGGRRSSIIGRVRFRITVGIRVGHVGR